jgi:hypothetical protein
MEFRLTGGKCRLLANGETVSTLEVAPLADQQEVKLWALKGLSLFQKIEVKVLDDATARQMSSNAPTTATASTSAAEIEDAHITISCSSAVRIAPLKVGQISMFDSVGGGIIKSVSPELSDWQFVCIPWHQINAYEIHVNQDGVLYAFGSAKKDRPVQALLGLKDISEWESAPEAIIGQTFYLCVRRKVKAGEVIKLHGMELRLAAKRIQLDSPVSYKKPESPNQTTASPPTTPTLAPSLAPRLGQPWINSLGMKFVPVPGTAVQFSIWDTRVQDYQAFVTATGRAWEKPPFEQGPTHPAVMVSWDDAKAFCAWLTEKERRAGTLNASQEYRLPTDLEWSAAVGLGNEIGSTPEERCGKIRGVFPWGTQWPVPPGACNYCQNIGSTTPVGSFAANRYGLYDMAGNVCQWCEDFYDGQSGNHVQRGSSWNFGPRLSRYLLSSFRNHIGYDNRRLGEIGFRCVLAGGGVSAP